MRRELAERSWRAREPTFTHGNEARRALSASVHNRMLERMERVMRKELGNEAREDAERSGEAETAVREADAREEDGNAEARDDDANAPETSRAANDASDPASLSVRTSGGSSASSWRACAAPSLKKIIERPRA